MINYCKSMSIYCDSISSGKQSGNLSPINRHRGGSTAASQQPASSATLNPQQQAPAAAGASTAACPLTPPPSSVSTPLYSAVADEIGVPSGDTPPKLPPKPRHLSGQKRNLQSRRASTQAQGALLQAATSGHPNRLNQLPI